MNRQVLLCRSILENPSVTQRELAEQLFVSLGTINSLMKECLTAGYIKTTAEGDYQITDAGIDFLKPFQVDGALFIAAGFGSRFVPLTFETPKGLLEVQGERMIERQIKQLHQAGIKSIYIVVGYLKEKFEYLIDKYDVTLIYNPEYAVKNTLATLYHARKALAGKNMYILSSDNWMKENMFHQYEPDAWYSSAKMAGETSEWCISYNKKGLITDVTVGGRDAWVMYGPAFFSREFSHVFLPALEHCYHQPGTEQFYWEQVYVNLLKEKSAKSPAPAMYINRQKDGQVFEFENLEELRSFDVKYQNQSNNQAMELVSQVFQVPESEIVHIRCLKAGMTNKSFLFQIRGKHYICRIPGPGTDLLINRRQEKAVYDTVSSLEITERVLYFNGDNGYKISEYYEDARTADSESPEDMSQCMGLLRRLHQADLQVDHRFDLQERIQFYESLCLAHGPIPFEDYKEVRKWMFLLMEQLRQRKRPLVLCHVDPVVDNFLFRKNGTIQLIDWEYSGMADPLLDVAMCSIYSYYDFEQAVWLLTFYLEREPTDEERYILTAYMALSGFLWSLWAVYKSNLGEEFGEYTIIMYRYAKNGYRKLFPPAALTNS